MNESDLREATLHPDRQLNFTGSFNFRDLGGYETTSGRSVKWRTIFRADAVHRLPDNELDQLAEIGLKTIIDLRTTTEVDEGHLHDPDRGMTHVHLDVLGEVWKPLDLDPNADAGDVLSDLYVHMLGIGAPALSAAFHSLANAENLPAVFHCAAGKDRTGVLAAMVLSSLGVADHVIIADYAISGSNMTALIERLKSERPEALTAMNNQPSAYLAAPPEAMTRLLVHVNAEYGSMSGYMRSIGINNDAVESMAHSLLD
ncbi:MAG: tyrosine-protein phosphatase [Acidimicrobiales bacterium]